MSLRKDIRNQMLYHLFVAAFGVVMLYPLLWMLASSFKAPSEIFRFATSLVPRDFTWGNYVAGWQGFGGVTFATFFKNSFIIAGIGTLGTLVASVLTAFGFARIRFSGQRFWFVCMLATLMLPIQVQMIPQYILFSELGWVNTFAPLLVPFFFGEPFFIFLMIQFIRGIPTELDESAEIDGATKLEILWWVILPLLKPAITTAAIFSFYWKWDDFLGPLIYLNQSTLYPVSLALKNFADPSSVTNWGAIFAMSSLSLVPVLVLFIWFQKHLVHGISTSGLKG